jgi:hypothetical protein
LRKENHVVRQSADFPTAGPTVRILLAPTVSQRQRPAGCSAPHSCQTRTDPDGHPSHLEYPSQQIIHGALSPDNWRWPGMPVLYNVHLGLIRFLSILVNKPRIATALVLGLAAARRALNSSTPV